MNISNVNPIQPVSSQQPPVSSSQPAPQHVFSPQSPPAVAPSASPSPGGATAALSAAAPASHAPGAAGPE